MKTKQNYRLHYYLAGKLFRHTSIALGLAAVLFAPSAAFAQPNAIAQEYKTTSSAISTGSLVSLASSDTNQVVPATSSNATNLAGVAADKPLLELSSSSSGGTSTLQVAVGGSTDVLVSDANGTVKAGDKITVSPLAGIGMKAIGSGEIVGTAQASLNSVKTIVHEFKGTNGTNVTVHVGLIPVAVTVAYYSAASSSDSVSAFVPPFLQSLANEVAGKAVSPLRVIIGTVALVLGFFAVTVMLYTGVRSGVISLGRNPLAASALRQGMVDVLIGAVGVLVVTGVIVGAVVLT